MLNKQIIALIALISIVKSESNIQEAKEVLKTVDYILDSVQPGNVCMNNKDCYPINLIYNLCCIRNGFVGKCCNMFAFISLRPNENIPIFFEQMREINGVILFLFVCTALIVSIVMFLLCIKFFIWICCNCRDDHSRRFNYYVIPHKMDMENVNLISKNQHDKNHSMEA